MPKPYFPVLGLFDKPNNTVVSGVSNHASLFRVLTFRMIILAEKDLRKSVCNPPPPKNAKHPYASYKEIQKKLLNISERKVANADVYDRQITVLPAPQ